MKLYKLALSYEELMKIPFTMNEAAEEVKAQAKQESEFGFELPVMNEILVKSLKSGQFTFRSKRISHCPLCKKNAGYAKYTRNSKYHRKGDNNYKRPLTMTGYKVNEGFVSVQGLGDFCSDCNKEHQILDRITDYLLVNRLEVELVHNEDSIFKKDPVRICHACKEEMYESEMGELPALLSGRYKGQCPHCEAKSLPFGKSHKTTDKFRMIEIKGGSK